MSPVTLFVSPLNKIMSLYSNLMSPVTLFVSPLNKVMSQ